MWQQVSPITLQELSQLKLQAFLEQGATLPACVRSGRRFFVCKNIFTTHVFTIPGLQYISSDKICFVPGHSVCFGFLEVRVGGASSVPCFPRFVVMELRMLRLHLAIGLSYTLLPAESSRSVDAWHGLKMIEVTAFLPFPYFFGGGRGSLQPPFGTALYRGESCSWPQ